MIHMSKYYKIRLNCHVMPFTMSWLHQPQNIMLITYDDINQRWMDSTLFPRQVSSFFANTLCQQRPSIHQQNACHIFLGKVSHAFHQSDIRRYLISEINKALLLCRRRRDNGKMSQYVFIDQSGDAGNCFQREETFQRGCCGLAAAAADGWHAQHFYLSSRLHIFYLLMLLTQVWE